jgi:hypothetical protein
MSKVAITGNAAGTGVFTVASPNSNVDRVLTLPDESGTVDTLQRSGNVIQVVNFQTGAAATGTGLIPIDDTIPQITEGNEYMTLAITPTNANNKLKITVVAMLSNDTSDAIIACALFVGATANALAVVSNRDSVVNEPCTLMLEHVIVAGVVSALTFRVRVGANSTSTTTFNGISTTRRYGGVESSTISIMEYTP